jgi:hypothetical protein
MGAVNKHAGLRKQVQCHLPQHRRTLSKQSLWGQVSAKLTPEICINNTSSNSRLTAADRQATVADIILRTVSRLFFFFLSLPTSGWKKIYQANGSRKQAGVAILISGKVDFKPTWIKRDKEGHSILTKGEIDQKEIIIINLYAPNVNTSNFIKHTLKDQKAYINANKWLWETLTPHYHQ